jgi:hypothetical protein
MRTITDNAESVLHEEMDETKTTRNIRLNFSLVLRDLYYDSGKYQALTTK